MRASASTAAARYPLAILCGFAMYFCAAVFAGVVVYPLSHMSSHFVGIIFGLPAIAAAMFVLTAANVPGLLAPGRLVFPLNLTLPPVFAAYTVLSVVMLTNTGSSLTVPFDGLRVATLWTSKEVLMIVTGTQIICLSALTRFKREPVD